MPKVLFTHSYFIRFDPKQYKKQQPYAPLATITAAALIRSAGYAVSLFDTMFSKGPSELEVWLKKEKPDYLVIYDDSFNYLTKMCLTRMRGAAFAMCSMAKKAGIKTVVSGSDASDHYEKYLAAGAEVVIRGEAELTLLEVLEKGFSDLEHISGIAWLNNGSAVTNPSRPVLSDLDALPIAAWDLVSLEEYRRRWMRSEGFFTVNIATTRGCTFKCNWCAKPLYGNRYHSRSPQKVVEEIKMLKEIADFDYIWFCDDIFGLKPGWIAEFGSLLKEARIKIKYRIQSRADLLLRENTIEDLAASGCDEIWIGAESGSQKILDAMEKGITVEQIYRAAERVRAAGMKAAFFLQLGYLGETAEDIKATRKMLFEIMPDDIGISVSYPLPGTKFYDKVSDTLGQKANWTDSDDLAMMFRNNFRSEYYRKLHRYIHKKFRSRQAARALKELVMKPGAADSRQLRKAISYFYFYPLSHLAGLRLKYAD